MSEFTCQKCNCVIGKRCTKPDPCIGYLPGVFNACCGHGKDEEAYICFGFSKEASVDIRGKKALKIMQAIRQGLGSQSNKSWHEAFEEAGRDKLSLLPLVKEGYTDVSI